MKILIKGTPQEIATFFGTSLEEVPKIVKAANTYADIAQVQNHSERIFALEKEISKCAKK